MQEIRSGELLRRFRTQKNASLRGLSMGICTASMLADYESGKYIPDNIVFERFLERLGVSPEKYAFMLLEEEYAYYTWKENVYTLLEEKNWKQLELYLDEKESLRIVGNEKIQKQFYCYMKGIVEGTAHRRYKEAVEYLQTAIEQTIPDMNKIIGDKIILGVTELHMILMYLNYGLAGNIIEEFNVRQLFYELERYIKEGLLEKDEQAKIYPKLVCIMLSRGSISWDIEERLEICKRALEIQKEVLKFHDMTELLKQYIWLLEKSESTELTFYKKQYETFLELLQQGDADTEFRPEYISVKMPKIFLIKEYLMSKRKSKGLTQRKVSEGICEPETYSRIETGGRSPLPSNLSALAERLDIGWCYYRGELDTDLAEMYWLRKQHRIAALKDDWKESLRILQKMEQLLNMDSPINKQYIECKKGVAKCHLHYIDANRLYELDKELLSLTMQLDTTYEGLVYYSQTELEIIGDMAYNLRRMKKYDEGIQLLESVLGQTSKSRVKMRFQWNGFSFVLRILAGLYFATQQYEKAIEILKLVYREEIREKDAGNLPVILDAIADNLEHMGPQYSEVYKKLYRQTYYVADFYGIGHIIKFAKNYYMENFDKDYIWYPD